MEYEDDIISILKCSWCCYKAHSFTSKLLNQSKMGLFTLHICCVLCSLDYIKLKLDSKSRLPISDFSGYNCILAILS